ncbi:uncharacterized protein LOC111108355 isoform X1 [Crassostrea virginica]
MSYSSLMTKIWPPPNDEVKSRLERLQELKQLRETRQTNVRTTPTPAADSTMTSEGSRLSRRQLLSTRTLPTLRRQEERRLKTTLEKKTEGDQSDFPGVGVSRGDFGGARPKNLSSSLRASEILTSIKNNEAKGNRVERYRTSSAESDTFDEHRPSENVISQSNTARLTSIGTLGSLADEAESSEVKVQDVSVESDGTDHIEDIESFKQSLYGTVSVTNGSGIKNVSSDKVLIPFTDISGIISPPVSRRAPPSKSENRTQIGDSSRWRKNVPEKSPEKINPVTVSIEETINKDLPHDAVENGVTVSDRAKTENGVNDTTENRNSENDEISTKANSTFHAAKTETEVSDNGETLPVNEKSGDVGNVLLFDGENITVPSDSHYDTLQVEGEVSLNHDSELERTGFEIRSEISDRNRLLDSSGDQVVHGSFNTLDLTSDFSVRSQADMSDYRDSILNESDSIFDFGSESATQEDEFYDGQDSWLSDWSSTEDSRRAGERPSLYTSRQSSWQTERPSFDRSGGYAPKPSRRTVLTAPNRTKATTKITRYGSLPSSADSRVSDIRSRYLSRDQQDSYLYGGGYETEDRSVSSYRETKQQDISSRLGNILSDSFKKFDSVLDGSDLMKKTEEPTRNLRRSNSQRVESVTDTRTGRYRKTSEENTDSSFRSSYNTSYSSVPQPNVDIHEFISNIRSRTSGDKRTSDSGISGYNKPLARAGGVSSVIENARKMLLGIQDDEPEVNEIGQFEHLPRQTEILTESLEESGKLDDGEVCEDEDQLEEDVIDNSTEVLLEKGDIIKLSSEPKKEMQDEEEANLQSVEVDEDTVLVNRTTSDSVTKESDTKNNQSSSSPSNVEDKSIPKRDKPDNSSKNVKSIDSSYKPAVSNKGKNKKKKKGKKKKDSEPKAEPPSSTENKSQNGKKIEVTQTEDVLTVTIEDAKAEENSPQEESTGSVGKQFDSMIEDIEHQSEKTSVATDDVLSLGEEPDSVSSQSESSNSIQQSEKSKNIYYNETATIEEEDTLNADKNMKNGNGNNHQIDAEQFETASEEEFYESVPGELVDEEGNTFVEHREQFIYVTSGSKVRKRKLSKRSLLGEKNQEGVKPQNNVDSSRIGHVKEWMDSNIFPSNNTLNEKDLGVKSSDQGSRLSVASTIGDFGSRGSLDSKDKLEDMKTMKDESGLSRGTSKGSVASVKRSTSVQTQDVSVKDSFTQMLIKARNIGVQVDVDVFEKFVQTLEDFVCPCCKHKFNIQEGLSTSSDDGQQSKEKDVQKVKEELKLKLPASNEDEIKIMKSKSSSSSSSKSSSSRNSMATPPKSPSIASSTKRSPHGTPREKSPSVTPRKQSPSPLKKVHSSVQASTRKSPASTPRKQSPTRKSPAPTPRKQSPTRKSPASTPRKQSPNRKSPAPTPRKQSPTRKSPASTPRKQSPAREGVVSKTKKLSPSNSTDQSNGDTLRENSKVRKERVSSVQNLLYQNGEQMTEKKLEADKKPGTPKVKREKSFDRQKREASADRRSDDGSSEKNELPGYMQPTKSSRRKKSIGNKEDLLDDSRQKKGSPSTHQKNESENVDQEVLPTVSNNPFIRSDRQRTSVGPNGQRSSGKWYRKEPLKTEDDGKKGKTKSPKKQRSISTSSEKNLFSESVVVKSDRKLRSSEHLDLSGLGSQSSLLETDLDEAMGCRSGRSETSQGSDSVHETMETIPFQTNSVFLGPDLKSYAENVSRNIAEKEVMKLSGDTDQCEVKSPVQLSLPPGAESKEADLKVTKTLESTGDSATQPKLLSDEEQAGVPLETEQEEEEVAPVRVNLSSWDPTKLLQDLYTVKLLPDNAKDISDKFVAMEGLMEKLPMNKKKATLLKTWKRRFFRAKDGWLYYYETSNRDKPSDTLQLMGGKVDDLGNRILGIDDGRGKYLMVRCPSDKEYGQWKLALESQTADNVKATYVRPLLSCLPHSQKKVILIDIGSSAIRAGILGEQPTLPSLFFPNMVAQSGGDQDPAVGIEAFRPEHRKALTKTVNSKDKVDKDVLQPFSIDMSTIGAVFKKVFAELKVEPAEYWVMISTPQNLGDKIRAGLMEILIDTYHVQGVCMVMQSLLALYSYNATSGIIVDVGERMEILPIFDGFVIEGGVSMQSYGGQKVLESLNSCLHGYKFSTPIQQLIVRYVMEQSCYLVTDYKDTLKRCEQDPENYRTTVYLNNFDLPQGATMEVTHDYSCFQSPEGFFNTDLWGMDYPCVHKLVFQAIQSCPIDSRKRMYRAVYLSGGVTMLPGFAERLQSELQKLAPPSVMVEVHASPQRYHSAYIGACSLARMEQFQQICITAEEWKKDGVKTFKKWNMSG